MRKLNSLLLAAAWSCATVLGLGWPTTTTADSGPQPASRAKPIGAHTSLVGPLEVESRLLRDP